MHTSRPSRAAESGLTARTVVAESSSTPIQPGPLSSQARPTTCDGATPRPRTTCRRRSGSTGPLRRRGGRRRPVAGRGGPRPGRPGTACTTIGPPAADLPPPARHGRTRSSGARRTVAPGRSSRSARRSPPPGRSDGRGRRSRTGSSSGDGRHLRVGQPVGVVDDGQGVAGHGALGEHIDLAERAHDDSLSGSHRVICLSRSMANRLAGHSSPYLLQHADNPVDWQEWGADAFAEARRRDVPVLLSVGYAACHWCHVMAHESFEDDEVAAVVNAAFVAVKVDREERPDIDAVYMAATTALTGSRRLADDLPAHPRRRPLLRRDLLPEAAVPRRCCRQAGRRAGPTQRDRVLRVGLAHRRATARSSPPPAPHALGADVARRRGDTGCAPVRRRPQRVSAAHRSSRRRWCWSSCCATTRAPVRPTPSPWPRGTCEAMARGGMYDQLGGGFARYCRRRPVGGPPLREDALRQRPAAAGLRPPRTAAPGTPWPAGSPWRPPTSCCATCARSRAVSPPRSTPTLDGHCRGPDLRLDARAARRGARRRGRRPRRGAARRSRDRGPSSTAPRPCSCPPTPTTRLVVERPARAAARGRAPSDPQPAATTRWSPSWNGLAIAALADAGALLDRPDLRRRRRGRAPASSSTPTSSTGGCDAPRGTAWSARRPAVARRLRQPRRGAARAAPGDRCAPAGSRPPTDLLDRRSNASPTSDGGFHDTADDAEQLFTRPRSAADNAEPSGQSALAGALLTCCGAHR